MVVFKNAMAPATIILGFVGLVWADPTSSGQDPSLRRVTHSTGGMSRLAGHLSEVGSVERGPMGVAVLLRLLTEKYLPDCYLVVVTDGQDCILFESTIR